MRLVIAIAAANFFLAGILASPPQLTTAERSKPKHASVDASKEDKYQSPALPPQELFNRLSRSVFVVEAVDEHGSTVELGSGVAVGSEQVVTNYHVVERGDSFRVRQHAKTWPATIAHIDPDHDLCQLRVQGLKVPPVSVRLSATVAVGERVYAIGAPQGLELTLSEGLVSGLREFDEARVIQTTAALSPGSSGGGLFDAHGGLVGITTFFVTEGQNLNFALPGEWVLKLGKSSVSEQRKGDGETPGLQALEWFTLGTRAFTAGEYEKAIQNLQQAIRLKPDAFGGWGILGLCYLELKHYDQAIKAFQEAIRLKPDSAESWDSLARASGEAEEYDEAVKAAQEAIRLRPDDVEAWAVLGGTYGALQRFDEAIKALKEAIRLKPDYAAAWYNLGNVYGTTKKYDEAVRAHEEAVRLEPKDPRFWYNLGHSYALQGNRSKVIEVYQKLKTLDPDGAEQFFKANVLP